MCRGVFKVLAVGDAFMGVLDRAEAGLEELLMAYSDQGGFLIKVLRSDLSKPDKELVVGEVFRKLKTYRSVRDDFREEVPANYQSFVMQTMGGKSARDLIEEQGVVVNYDLNAFLFLSFQDIRDLRVEQAALMPDVENSSDEDL